MFDQFALGVYVPGDGVLHRLQARTKLLALVWLACFVTIANQFPFRIVTYGALLALVGVAAAFSGLGWRYLAQRMWLIVLLMVVGAVPLALLAGDEAETVLYRLGPILVTQESVLLAVRLTSALLALYTLALLLTATTRPVALLEGLTLLLGPLRRIGLPVDTFALMVLLTLRFIPTLGADVEALAKAQLARGADFMHGSLRERRDNLAALIVPVFQSVWRRAEAVATALDARGYAEGGQQTVLHETALTMRDYLALAVVIVVSLAALFV